MNNDELERILDIDQLGGIDEEVAHPEIHFCSFKVGGLKLTIPIETVREIIDLSDTLPLPGSPVHLRGLVHLRGEVIPVIDMSKIYEAHYDKETEKKLIIIEVSNESIALISDGMPDLLDEEEGQIIDINEFFEKYKVT